MGTRLYSIVGRLKTHEMNYSTADDFELAGERSADASIILTEPGWSP